jgi:hypothetical protein
MLSTLKSSYGLMAIGDDAGETVTHRNGARVYTEKSFPMGTAAEVQV